MARSPIQVLVLLMRFLEVQSLFTLDTFSSISCISNCSVSDSDKKTINGRAGDTIALQFTVDNENFVRFDLFYDNIKSLTVYESRVLLIPGRPSFLDFSETGKSYIKKNPRKFTFEILSLNASRDQEKILKHHLKYIKGTEEYDSEGIFTLNVQHRPKIIDGDWKKRIHFNENESFKTNISLSGNPRPSVHVHMGDQILNVTSHPNDTDPYTFNIKSPPVTRKQCGRNLTLSLTGYKNITFVSKINVTFTPSTPILTKATFKRKCLHIQWKGIETGLCPVFYLLTFSYGNVTTRLLLGSEDVRINITINTTQLEHRHCFGFVRSVTDIKVRARSNGRWGAFSNPTNVVFIEPVPIHSNNDERYMYMIIIIVICVLVLFDIALLLFVRDHNSCKYCVVSLTIVGLPILLVYFILRSCRSGKDVKRCYEIEVEMERQPTGVIINTKTATETPPSRGNGAALVDLDTPSDNPSPSNRDIDISTPTVVESSDTGNLSSHSNSSRRPVGSVLPHDVTTNQETNTLQLPDARTPVRPRKDSPYVKDETTAQLQDENGRRRRHRRRHNDSDDNNIDHSNNIDNNNNESNIHTSRSNHRSKAKHHKRHHDRNVDESSHNGRKRRHRDRTGANSDNNNNKNINGDHNNDASNQKRNERHPNDNNSSNIHNRQLSNTHSSRSNHSRDSSRTHGATYAADKDMDYYAELGPGGVRQKEAPVDNAMSSHYSKVNHPRERSSDMSTGNEVTPQQQYAISSKAKRSSP